VHTTAATSLDSLSSITSNHQDCYSVHAGQKRKRTTRREIATVARRREAGVDDALLSYQPPLYPHKKASDIPVKLIHDVSNKTAVLPLKH
jgi:dual-specificity kinase